MLERHVSAVVGHLSERTSGSKYDIAQTLELALSQLHIFLLDDELTRSEIKTRLSNIRSAQELDSTRMDDIRFGLDMLFRDHHRLVLKGAEPNVSIG